MGEQFQDAGPKLYDHFLASLMGQSYRDISQTSIADLLLQFGSAQGMHEVARSGDPSFEKAIMRGLSKQLRIPISAAPHGSAAKKNNLWFLKKTVLQENF